MNDSVLLTGLVALTFAAVHILGRAMRFLQATPRSIWLSLSGGVSLAYVFVHLLPELAAHQRALLEHLSITGETAAGALVYVTALVGLVAFYGLDRFVRSFRGGRDSDLGAGKVFWLHLASYTIYNALVGFLLVHQEEGDPRSLLIYALALGLHFIVNDQGLRQHHGDLYDREGRWILAAAPVVGWGLGLIFQVTPLALASVFAFLAGGIILNVLKEELPDDRESRFWALGAGAALFAALLLLAR